MKVHVQVYYYHKEDIPGAYTFYTYYSLLTVIMCNLGPGHNNEVRTGLPNL